jgi:germination protein M
MKKTLALILIFLIVLPFSGCSNKDKTSLGNKDKIKEITFPNEKDQIIDLNIFYDASENDDKASIAYEERVIQKEALLGETIMNELIKGPSRSGKLKPILPLKTKLLSFSIKNNIAYVDLSSDAKIAMSAIKEEACLKSIANSLTQLPSILKIQILIEHESVDTLGGNYTISKPFGKDDVDERKR